MQDLYLDTHVVEWIAEGKHRKLTKVARQAIDRASRILVSPMVLLEMEYLREIGRKRKSRPAPESVVAVLGFEVCGLPFEATALAALREVWTRDPFDRLIVANAIANRNSPLVAADEKIRANYPKAIW